MKPECRQSRGYDTNVIIEPPLARSGRAAEETRTVTVTCHIHDRGTRGTFSVRRLSDADVAAKQAELFDLAFAVLERRCSEHEAYDYAAAIAKATE